MPAEIPESITPPQQPAHDWDRYVQTAAKEWQLDHAGVRALFDNHLAPKAGLGRLSVGAEAHEDVEVTPDMGQQAEGGEGADLHAKREAAEKLRAAYRGWLERRDIQPEDTPHFTMPKRELTFLRNVGFDNSDETTSFFVDKTREKYNIPPDAQYAWVDVKTDDPQSPHPTTPKLVKIDKEDFGTVIEEGRPESQRVGSEHIPRITMNKRELEGLSSIGVDGSNVSSRVAYARALYDIPDDDQYAPQYALVDVVSDNPDLPHDPQLVLITEADFGTIIEPSVIAKDFQNTDSGPNDPLAPNSGGALRTVTISRETFSESAKALESLATAIMKGKTINPFSSEYEDVAVRAGDLMPGQQKAYVWERSPFAEAVRLTLNIPGQYDSVCIVRGQRREAENGKSGMAQIEHPTEVLKIEGANLKELQNIYQRLYDQPDFTLTKEQQEARDGLFNDQLTYLISEEAKRNKAQQVYNAQMRNTQPNVRARELPDSYR